MTGNTCTAVGGKDIQTVAECETAFKKILEGEIVASNPVPWQGANAQLPPGCSMRIEGTGKWLQNWNTDTNGINNGAYYKICIGPL